ncbi:hypothetical protein A1Q1_01978 [Trichosporon asahii var. asahii CBS 2479]|uniref:Uncharacterized protein n=1 Tax=Trichosporon asahii var. asahii (strain ATCC 90039 / CBS 2479 / JCM 2466 / KCTC 7840 / NBRC 103889/ NCYC 2677 / UAMH 7654) TaxID=1186058 RepID=J6F1A8_TRIAS|nr:hypothetical protein A1Q1_01978 [Trichosporon asahii var. asahii CBS 2479]EJT48942.1 hypothetical protein A1Q1_01978 [Trichosporon asahii var. asahii CBS 2479]
MTNIAWGRFLTTSAVLFLPSSAPRATPLLVELTAVIGGGYALLVTTTPTEEELYNRLSPDLRRKVDEIRRQREGGDNAVKEQLAAAGDTDKIVWASELNKK